MLEKKVGYFLFITGIVMMFFSLIQIVAVALSYSKPLSLFNKQVFESVNTQAQKPAQENDLFGMIPQELREAVSVINSSTQSFVGFPIEIIIDSLNIGAFFILMHFILGFGYKMAKLGILLLKSDQQNRV